MGLSEHAEDATAAVISGVLEHPSDLLPARLPDGTLLGSELAVAHLGSPI